MKPSKILGLLVLVLLSVNCTAKTDRGAYLRSKVDDAAAMCREQIAATAKDPSSVQFAERYSFGFGSALTRNWIFINWEIMGRNTYGAVLRHRMSCTVSCKQGKACTWVGIEDAPA